jgi:CheY-like chemotaxis protein
MMGGDISVRSAKGQGSVFTVRLPARVRGLAHPTDTQQAVAPMLIPADLDTQEFPYDESEAQLTILVIDDDATVHDLMKRSLEPAGYRVMSAFDGRYGLELARQFQPRAITLDISMPGMDGWSVLTELKGNAVTSGIPVIMTSVIEDRGLAFALGASEYLTKPLDRRRLLNVLHGQESRLRGKRVLVIEDDESTRQLAGRIIATLGCEVEYASDGEEALDLIRSGTEPPALILLDLMMPKVDGFGFLEEMRKHERWANIPVVVTTAKELTSEDRSRLRGQVDQVLRKGDYTRDDLVREVATALK